MRELVCMLFFILYTSCYLNGNKYGCSRQMDFKFDFDLRIGNKIVFNNTNCVNIGSGGIFKSDISFRIGRGILHSTLLPRSQALKRSFPKVSQDLCQDPTSGCQLPVKSTKWGINSTLENVNRNICPQCSIDLHSPSTVLGLH